MRYFFGQFSTYNLVCFNNTNSAISYFFLVLLGYIADQAKVLPFVELYFFWIFGKLHAYVKLFTPNFQGRAYITNGPKRENIDRHWYYKAIN
ncbi:hypothetical protein ASG37_07640 [Sphingomonas sp. Leaf407]|nr:hypothetical protein ASE97_04930 [Sphingomonas sp. Leaf42]KQT28708.1 hypothetical protein ASG37_07640 [Sphingomonas sp. Leaf407]